MKLSDAAILIGAEGVEVVAERTRGNVLGIHVSTIALALENSVCGGLAKLIHDDAVDILIESGDLVRVSDEVGGHELQADAVGGLANREAAIAIYGPHLQRHANQLAEGVASGHVGLLAPCVEILGDGLVVFAISGSRAPLVRRAVEGELFRHTSQGREVGDEIAGLKHHDAALASGAGTLGGNLGGSRRE